MQQYLLFPFCLSTMALEIDGIRVIPNEIDSVVLQIHWNACVIRIYFPMLRLKACATAVSDSLPREKCVRKSVT